MCGLQEAGIILEDIKQRAAASEVPNYITIFSDDISQFGSRSI
jgi:hypothetical protein